jgi:hypothetical protein
MKKILWTQNEKSSIPSTIMNSEGEVISVDALRDGGFELFDELLDYQKSSIELFIENNLVIKRNVQKGIIPKTIGYFISSAYENTDDIERLMPFMFFIESKDVEEIVKNLEAFSAKINRKLFVSDVENIKKHIKKHRIKKKNKIIIGVVLVIIIIIIIIIYGYKLDQ